MIALAIHVYLVKREHIQQVELQPRVSVVYHHAQRVLRQLPVQAVWPTTIMTALVAPVYLAKREHIQQAGQQAHVQVSFYSF
jgi:hypothetical protein